MTLGLALNLLGASGRATIFKVGARSAVSSASLAERLANEDPTWRAIVEWITLVTSPAGIIQDVSKYEIDLIRPFEQTLTQVNLGLDPFVQDFPGQRTESEIIVDVLNTLSKLPIKPVRSAASAGRRGAEVFDDRLGAVGVQSQAAEKRLTAALEKWERWESLSS